MALNVAVQMDPIERINVHGDSTFALLLEAQARGHKLSYYTPDRMAIETGAATCASSAAISPPEFPAPTTRTRRPANGCGR